MCFYISERLRRRPPTAGSLLHQGCAPAHETHGEAQRHGELHRDGKSDWRAPQLPPVQGATDQGALHFLHFFVFARSRRFELVGTGGSSVDLLRKVEAASLALHDNKLD